MRSTFRYGLLVAAVLAIAPLAQSASAAQTAESESYDTLGGRENGGDSFTSGGPRLLNEILTPHNPTQLTELVLNVELARRDLGSFDVVVSRVTAAGLPTSVRVIGTISDKNLTRNFKRISFMPASPVYLAADQHFYVGILKHSGAKSTVTLGNTLTPSVLARGPVESGGFYYNNGGRQANSGGPYEMFVQLIPVAR